MKKILFIFYLLIFGANLNAQTFQHVRGLKVATAAPTATHFEVWQNGNDFTITAKNTENQTVKTWNIRSQETNKTGSLLVIFPQNDPQNPIYLWGEWHTLYAEAYLGK